VKESTILTGCVDFDTSMNIRYRGIYEINANSQKFGISDIIFINKFILLIEILKLQGNSQKK
jgi:hypothetical protein